MLFFVYNLYIGLSHDASEGQTTGVVRHASHVLLGYVALDCLNTSLTILKFEEK